MFNNDKWIVEAGGERGRCRRQRLLWHAHHHQDDHRHIWQRTDDRREVASASVSVSFSFAAFATLFCVFLSRHPLAIVPQVRLCSPTLQERLHHEGRKLPVVSIRMAKPWLLADRLVYAADHLHVIDKQSCRAGKIRVFAAVMASRIEVKSNSCKAFLHQDQDTSGSLFDPVVLPGKS